MKLGLQLGYWGAQPPTGTAEVVAAAEEEARAVPSAVTPTRVPAEG